MTPYFIPPEGLAGALALAAYRGVDVRVYVPDPSNHFIADLAAASRYAISFRPRVLKRSFNLQYEKLENATLKITLDKWAPSRHVNAVEIYGTSAPWSEHGQDRGAALIEPMRRSQY